MYASQQQHNINDEEIKNLFFFLCDDDPSSNKEKMKAADVIFGLENLSLPIPPESIRLLKNEIEKRAKDDYISLDDFKMLWKGDIAMNTSAKELSVHMFNMMGELLSGTENKNDNLNEYQLHKINAKMLEELLDLLGVCQDTPDGDDDRKESGFSLRRSSIKKNSVIKRKDNQFKGGENKDNLKFIAEEMITAVVGNPNGEISIKEFEFVLNEYINSLNKK